MEITIECPACEDEIALAVGVDGMFDEVYLRDDVPETCPACRHRYGAAELAVMEHAAERACQQFEPEESDGPCRCPDGRCVC